MEDNNVSYATNRVIVVNRTVRDTVNAALIAQISVGIVTAFVCRAGIIRLHNKARTKFVIDTKMGECLKL
jgi:hypothetical protein